MSNEEGVVSESDSVEASKELNCPVEEVLDDEEVVLSGMPVSCDTAMCLLDPKIQELVDLQRKDVSLRHCFEDATREESCFVMDENTQVLFRRWNRLKLNICS